MASLPPYLLVQRWVGELRYQYSGPYGPDSTMTREVTIPNLILDSDGFPGSWITKYMTDVSENVQFSGGMVGEYSDVRSEAYAYKFEHSLQSGHSVFEFSYNYGTFGTFNVDAISPVLGDLTTVIGFHFGNVHTKFKDIWPRIVDGSTCYQFEGVEMEDLPSSNETGQFYIKLVSDCGVFHLGDRFPDIPEVHASGAITGRIHRGTPEFEALVENTNPNIEYKNEEETNADKVMTDRLSAKLDRLAELVSAEWRDTNLRVTEAWDEDGEHAENSLHYEGRAADITASDRDNNKLGRIAQLAKYVGFDWVWYEDAFHVHVSVRK